MAHHHPLHQAVKRHSLNDVRHILQTGNVAVDATDSDGFTAFDLACGRSFIVGMRALLDAGADPRQELRSPGTSATAALTACHKRQKKMLRLMLEFGISANEQSAGTSLLVAAVRSQRGYLRRGNLVGLLLEAGAEVDLLEDADGQAALHAAVLSSVDGDVTTVRQLLEAGASIDLRTGDAHALTALHIAATNGKRDVVDFLLRYGADVTKESGRGITPIEAVLNDLVDGEEKRALLALLFGHCDLDRDLVGALCRAASAASIERLQLLLGLGASPNAPDGTFSPLQAACEHGRVHVAELLMDAGAAVDAAGPGGTTALMTTASVQGTWESVLLTAELLLSRGADVNLGDLGSRTPLHLAMEGFMLPNKIRMVRLLLQHDADPNARDAGGRTPMYILCQMLVPEEQPFDPDDRLAAAMVDTLMSADADAEETADDGLMPLLLSVIQGRDLTLGEIFHHQADVLPDYSDDD